MQSNSSSDDSKHSSDNEEGDQNLKEYLNGLREDLITKQIFDTPKSKGQELTIAFKTEIPSSDVAVEYIIKIAKFYYYKQNDAGKFSWWKLSKKEVGKKGLSFIIFGCEGKYYNQSADLNRTRLQRMFLYAMKNGHDHEFPIEKIHEGKN